LPWLGRFRHENALASPASAAKTVVIGTDDSTPGEVYVYVGDKKGSGTTLEKAALPAAISSASRPRSATIPAPRQPSTISI
jgi:secreted PhoX family phosphatase